MKLMTRPGSPYLWYDFTIDTQRFRGSTKRLISEKKEAQAMLSKMYQEKLNQVQFGIKPDITLEHALRRAVEAAEGSTRRGYDVYTRKLTGGSYGGSRGRKGNQKRFCLSPDLPMSKVRQSDMDNLLSARKAEGCSAAAIGAEMRLMSRAYNLVKRSYAVTPDLTFETPKAFAKSRYLSDKEIASVETLLRAKGGSTADTALDLMTFLLDTGVRKSEATSAQWADLNLTEGTFEAYRSKTRSLSLVPLSPRLVLILRRRHNLKEPFGHCPGVLKVLADAIDQACNNDPKVIATRGKATIHTLRDTFATKMLRLGLTLYELSKLLGHTNIKMTSKYAHLEASDTVSKARSLLAAQS